MCVSRARGSLPPPSLRLVVSYATVITDLKAPVAAEGKGQRERRLTSHPLEDSSGASPQRPLPDVGGGSVRQNVTSAAPLLLLLWKS